jgi:hypothetical protein
MSVRRSAALEPLFATDGDSGCGRVDRERETERARNRERHRERERERHTERDSDRQRQTDRNRQKQRKRPSFLFVQRRQNGKHLLFISDTGHIGQQAGESNMVNETHTQESHTQDKRVIVSESANQIANNALTQKTHDEGYTSDTQDTNQG